MLLMGIIMLGIRNTIWYILKLGQEIRILEGGDLDYPITISSHDELSRLAEGLDSMRQSFLGQQGFRLEPDFVWKDCYVRVNGDYIVRIFDNLTSNIVKYGDREAPVELRTIYLGQSAGIAVRNRKADRQEKTESTRTGLRNIEKMMEKQGVFCREADRAGI